jgi:hypothetical protein
MEIAGEAVSRQPSAVSHLTTGISGRIATLSDG